MYNPQDSIDKTYNYIQGLRAKGKSYGGYPVYNVTKDDLQALMDITNKYGIPFEWMVNLINFESGRTFNPAIQNSIGATGLIQFMPSTAIGLGTTTSILSKMTFKQQLVYVDKYLYKSLKKHLVGGKIPNTFTQGDLFMTIFTPAAIGNPNYQFNADTTKANAGIKTPYDYTSRALNAAVFPLEAFPYTISEVKKKYGNIVTTKNVWIAIIAIIVIILAVLLFIYRQKIATYITKL